MEESQRTQMSNTVHPDLKDASQLMKEWATSSELAKSIESLMGLSEFALAVSSEGEKMAYTLKQQSEAFARLELEAQKERDEKRSELEGRPSEFRDNPEACERFKRWVESYDLLALKEKSVPDGKPMKFKHLAIVLGRSNPTASTRYKHPETIDAFDAWMLREFIGDREYADMIGGPGTYDRSEEKRRRDEIAQSVTEALYTLSEDEARDVLGFAQYRLYQHTQRKAAAFGTSDL